MKRKWVQFRPGVFAYEGETIDDERGKFVFEGGRWHRLKSKKRLPDELKNGDITGDRPFRRGHSLPETPL